MNTRLRIIDVNRVPSLAAKLGVLATVQIVGGSIEELSGTIKFEESKTRTRWRLTSIAHGTPATSPNLAVAFKNVSGDSDLSAGMELQQVLQVAT